MSMEVVNRYEWLSGLETSSMDVCCEKCGDMTEVAAGRNTCPSCEGPLVGIRIYRNPLSMRILHAERVEL
jgi:Zn finger protein HypA/HybF involved in hydrogenase expression